ncbi:MAG: DUF2017 family protein [Actinomycetaceae bacterium]|nr:DUF2017 family protein [Actinomycetaceae bacterium]
MKPFTPTPTGYLTRISRTEAHLLLRAIDEVVTLLDAPAGRSPLLANLAADIDAPQPTDRSLSNLLAPMSRDPGIAQEMRTLTEDDLRDYKTTRLCRIRDTVVNAVTDGGLVHVSTGEEWVWLGAMTDLRLALAGTLGATHDSDIAKLTQHARELARADDPAALLADTTPNPFVATVFLMLGAWQESLLAAMDGESHAH